MISQFTQNHLLIDQLIEYGQLISETRVDKNIMRYYKKYHDKIYHFDINILKGEENIMNSLLNELRSKQANKGIHKANVQNSIKKIQGIEELRKTIEENSNYTIESSKLTSNLSDMVTENNVLLTTIIKKISSLDAIENQIKRLTSQVDSIAKSLSAYTIINMDKNTSANNNTSANDQSNSKDTILRKSNNHTPITDYELLPLKETYMGDETEYKPIIANELTQDIAIDFYSQFMKYHKGKFMGSKKPDELQTFNRMFIQLDFSNEDQFIKSVIETNTRHRELCGPCFFAMNQKKQMLPIFLRVANELNLIGNTITNKAVEVSSNTLNKEIIKEKLGINENDFLLLKDYIKTNGINNYQSTYETICSNFSFESTEQIRDWFKAFAI